MKNNEENYEASSAKADELNVQPEIAEWAEELNADDSVLLENDLIVESMNQQAENAQDVLTEDLVQNEKRPVFVKPSFDSSFRGYKKDAVDTFIAEVLKVYNVIAKEQNYDLGLLEDAAKKIKSLESKIVKQDKKSEASLLAKAQKKSEEVTLKAKMEAEKIIIKAEAEASKLKAKAEAEGSKSVAVAAKLEQAAKIKAEAIVVKAEKAAKDAIAKAAKDAENILAKGKKEIDEAKRVMSQQKDINDRLVAFYTTQIKTLKAENKKFNK